MKTCYLDVETNGAKGCIEVIEIAAIIVEDSKIIDQYHRYYYPTKPFAFHSSKVHGLWAGDITKFRKEHALNDNRYVKYFEKDMDNLEKYLIGVDEIVAHNSNYDMKFMSQKIIDTIPSRCTMKTNKVWVGALNINQKLKNPRLEEFAIKLGFKYDDDKSHSALYDTQLLAKCDIEKKRLDSLEVEKTQLEFEF